jgi:Ca-activated chloride channel family protein
VRSLVLSVIVAASAAAVLTAQPGRFRSGIDLVNLAVMVEDRDGQAVADLARSDFEVYEDGRPQDLRYFLRGDADAEALHLRLGLLLDTSGSMTDDMSFARTAAVRFLKALPEAHDITLVDFDTEVRVARYGYRDFPRLVERIRTRSPEGWTALWDALGIYIDGIHSLDGRKILVVYSDGGDTRSAQTFSDVVAMLKASDVTVYAIGFLQHQSPSVRNTQQLRLRQLTEVTGGQAYFPLARKALDEVYEQVVAQVRAQYGLGFVSTNTEMDGTWRKIEVRLKGEHLKDLKIRSRRGYYAPYRQADRSSAVAAEWQP